MEYKNIYNWVIPNYPKLKANINLSEKIMEVGQ